MSRLTTSVIKYSGLIVLCAMLLLSIWNNDVGTTLLIIFFSKTLRSSGMLFKWPVVHLNLLLLGNKFSITVNVMTELPRIVIL